MKGLWRVALIIISTAAYSGEITPIRNFDSHGTFIYYHEQSITRQAARFDLPRPGCLRTVTVVLGGEKGSAQLHFYGNEGGLEAPVLENDLISPVNVVKKKSGIERITITLPEPLRCDGTQVFIGIDGLTPGVALLSDHRRKTPSCKSSTESYYYQLMQKHGVWSWGKYGYAIELGFEFDRISGKPTFSDATKDAHLPDLSLRNTSIAWADINGDGYLDLLAGGRLFRNSQDGEFTDITTSAGLDENPALQAFIDVNNDGSPDILVIGGGDSGAVSAIFINDREGNFSRTEVALPGIKRPECFSIADINLDGRPDIFIGQAADSTAGLLANNLFINEGNGRFSRDTNLLPAGGSVAGTVASQWVDYNNDGLLDLYTVDRDGIGTIWRNDGGKQLVSIGESTGRSLSSDSRIKGIGCGWADYNNDGAMDLLLPGPFAERPKGSRSYSVPASIMLSSGSPSFEIAGQDNALTAEYLEKRSGGAAGDIDNDGLLDAILTTSCNCSFVDIYKQNSSGKFEDRTYASGLWRVAGGPDAVWADYNNDGRLDLSIIRDGKIALFRNDGSGNSNNYIDISLDDPNGNRAGIGSRVTVYCGDVRYTSDVTSGRGLAMQDPLRLHAGIGSATRIDSVTVKWPNSPYAESFTDLAINKAHILKSGRASVRVAEGALRLQAAPNPFSEHLTFTYSLPGAMHVRLDVYSSTGELISTPLDDDETAGDHTVRWEAKDGAGRRLSQGTYVYRLVTPAGEVAGKAILRL